MKQFFLISLLLFYNIASAQQRHRSAGRKVDRLIHTHMEKLEIPGLAVAVIYDGKIIKKSVYGMGNLEWKNKITANSNFQSASCTKLLTSTLYLRAVYEQKINPDQFIRHYIPSCPDHWNEIKVKHLLNHSSGIKDFRNHNSYKIKDVVTSLKDSILLHPPGSTQLYTQSDFTILAYILETVYKKPFIALLYEKVLKPLNMLDGGFDNEINSVSYNASNIISEKVETYFEKYGLRRYKFQYPHYNYPAGGYFASINDWSNWAIGLYKNLLFPAHYLDLFNNITNDTASSYFSDAGWINKRINNQHIHGHSGGPGLAEIWRFVEKRYTFIILTNDGELLPGLAFLVASVYLPHFKPGITLSKFER